MTDISDTSTTMLTCRQVDMETPYDRLESAWLGIEHAHLLVAALGGFIIEQNGQSIRLEAGETRAMPSMARYAVVAGLLHPRTARTIGEIDAARQAAAAMASANHPEHTFTATPTGANGARLLVIARAV